MSRIHEFIILWGSVDFFMQALDNSCLRITRLRDFGLWLIPLLGVISCLLRQTGDPRAVAQDSCVRAGTLRYARVS